MTGVMGKSLLCFLKCGPDIIDKFVFEFSQESLSLRHSFTSNVGDILNLRGLGRRLMRISLAVEDLREVPGPTTVPSKKL